MTTSSTNASTPKARLVVAWALVAVPLGYGLVETLNRTFKLFTG